MAIISTNYTEHEILAKDCVPIPLNSNSVNYPLYDTKHSKEMN